MLGKYIKLNDGKEIPQFGFGTWQLEGEKAVKSSLSVAYDLGYRHIDTAQIYNNEYAIGDFIKEKNVDLKNTFITTKIWVSNFGGRESFMKSVKQSLKRLGVNKVNLLLLHWGLSSKITLQAYKWLEEAKDEGYTDSIGVSNFNIKLLEETIKVARHKPVINQVQFDLLNQQIELKEFCKANDIVFEGYSLLKPYLGNSSRVEMEKSQKDIVNSIGRKHNKTGAQVILRWALQEEIIIFPKSSNPDRIKQNSEIFDFQLDEEDIKALRSMNRNLPQKMDDVINGEWDSWIEKPLLFERKFKNVDGKLVNDKDYKIMRKI